VVWLNHAISISYSTYTHWVMSHKMVFVYTHHLFFLLFNKKVIFIHIMLTECLNQMPYASVVSRMMIESCQKSCHDTCHLWWLSHVSHMCHLWWLSHASIKCRTCVYNALVVSRMMIESGHTIESRHLSHVIPLTEKIRLKIITTAKIWTRFYGSPCTFPNRFSRESPRFKQVFMGVNEVPVTQKIYQENW